VAHVEHLGRFLHKLRDGVGARGRVVALEEVVRRLRGCAAIAGRAAAAEKDGVRLKELRRGLEPFWVASCAGRVGHVGAIFDPDEPARDERGGRVARCALRPPSTVEAQQRRLGVGHIGAGARRQRGRVGVVRLQAALVCRGLRRQQIVAGCWSCL